MEGLDNGAPIQCLRSPSTVFLTLTFWLFCPHSVAQEVSFLYLLCLQYRDFYQIARFEWCPRTDTTMVGRLSHRWGLSARGKGRSNPKRSTLRLMSTKMAISVGSSYFRLGGFLLPQHSAGGIERRHQVVTKADSRKRLPEVKVPNAEWQILKIYLVSR